MPGVLAQLRGKLSGDRFVLDLGVVVAVALALRAVYVLALDPVLGDGRFFGLGDWAFYHAEANLIADGHGYADPSVWQAEGRAVPTADHPPLWPTVLSAASALGFDGLRAHRFVGVALGCVAVALCGLLGRRVAGARAGVAAAALAAVYPVLIGADGSLMSETLYGVLALAALLAALALRDAPSKRRAAGLGALLGLAALTRGEALLLLAALAIPLGLATPGIRRVRLTRVAAVLAGAALVIAPWTVRNAVAFDAPVLIAVNDAGVLAGANCDPAYRGEGRGGWRFECIQPPPRGRNVQDAPEWRRGALRYASEHASEVPLVALARALRTWNLWRPFYVAGFATERDLRVERAGVVVFWLLVPIAVAGAVVLRRREAPLWVLLTVPLVVTAASVLGYGAPRFRHSADLVLVVLAGVAVAHVVPRVRGRGRPAASSGRWTSPDR